MITKETPDYDLKVLRMIADGVRHNLNIVETIRNSPEQNTQDLLEAGQKLINSLENLTLTENDTINSFYKEFHSQDPGVSPEVADNLMNELKKSHPDLVKAYEAKLVENFKEDSARISRGCPPLHNKVLPCILSK